MNTSAAQNECHTAEELSEAYFLNQNYPNPFHTSITITYALKKPLEIDLKIYDLSGMKITTLVNGYQSTGTYQVTWDGSDNSGKQVDNGIYFSQIRSGHSLKTLKIFLLR